MPKTAQQMAANYQAAMQSPNTQAKYKQGIEAFTGNPMELAASDQAMQFYLNRVTESVTSGKRARRLRETPRERWHRNAITVGANQLSVGAQKAKDKVDAHFAKWAPIYQQARDAARALPKGGKANALARVSAAMDVLMAAAGRA